MDILPESPARQHVPLWKTLPAPTPAITETGPPGGPVFLAPQTILLLLETSDVIGKIGNLGISDRCKHRRHHAIVAVPDVVAVLAHCLYKEILALIGDMRNAFTAGQIEIVAANATIVRNQRAASLHANGICWKRGKRRRRLLGKKFWKRA